MSYKIEYAASGRLRLSNDEYETEWLDNPDDGQLVVEMGDDVLFVTTREYVGNLTINSVFQLDRPLVASTEEVEETAGNEDDDSDTGDCDGDEDDTDDDDDEEEEEGEDKDDN